MDTIKTFFAFQSLNPTDDDYVSVDGVRVHNRESSEAVGFMDKFTIKTVKKERPWAEFIGNIFYFKGYLNMGETEKDITFSFVAKPIGNQKEAKKNINIIKQALYKEVENAGAKLSDNSRIYIETYKPSLLRNHLTLGLTILILAICVVLMKCCK